MELDIRDFLRRLSRDELRRRSIHPDMLSGIDVAPLIDLMKERWVTRLVAEDRGWFLTSDGEFANPGSREIKQGRVKDLQSPGNVFMTQNAYINPHYKGFRLAEKFPIVGYCQAGSLFPPGMAASARVPSRPVASRSNVIQSEQNLNTMDGPAGDLISFCHRRAQQFQDLEYALREMQASMSDDVSVDKIRRDIQQRKLNVISSSTYDELAKLHGARDVAFRKIFDTLEDLNKWELEVYEIILNACNARNPADLNAALAIVSNCRDDAVDAVREIPRLFSEQQRLEKENSSATTGGCIGITLGFFVGIFSCTAMVIPEEPNFLLGFSLFLAITVVGWFLGVVMGKNSA